MKIKLPIKMEIEWVDSCSSKGWGTRDYHIKDYAESHCRTIGYLVERTKKAISLAQSLSDDTKNLADVMSIPVVSIKKVKILK
jgi:hypothetical protein